MSQPFDYPATPHSRRHGPVGYSDHTSFRPWLRDEFAFRCVYCLTRESWGSVTGLFDIDHCEAVAAHPEARLAYDNLVFACAGCNAKKGDQRVPDPLAAFTSETVRVLATGEIMGSTPESQRLIRDLDLNRKQLKDFRRLVIDVARLSQHHDPDLYRRLMGFPDDLPDLSALRPPGGNTRPEGIAESHSARRRRGELPDTY